MMSYFVQCYVVSVCWHVICADAYSHLQTIYHVHKLVQNATEDSLLLGTVRMIVMSEVNFKLCRHQQLCRHDDDVCDLHRDPPPVPQHGTC